MQPQGMDAALYMLRLTSIELIYSNDPPVVVAGTEIAETIEADHDLNTVATDQHQRLIPINPPVSVVTSKPKAARNKAITMSNDPDNGEGKLDMSNQKPLAQVEISSFTSESKPSQKEKVLEVGFCPETPNPSLKQATSATSENNPDNLPKSKIKHKPKISIQLSQANADAQATSTEVKQVSIEDQQKVARKWLQEQGQAGEWLLQIVSEINQGHWQCGVDFLEIQDKCLIAFPSTAEKLKLDSNHFIKTLEEKSWLVVDVLSPMRKVQIINQVRGVVLATEPSEKMKLLLTRPEQSNTANQKSKQLEPAKTQNQEVASSPLSKATESKGKAKSKPSSPASTQEVEIETRLLNVQSEEYFPFQDDAYFEQIPESFYAQDGFQANQQAGTTEKQSPSVIASDVTVTTGKLDYQQAIKNLIEQVQQSQLQSKPADSPKSKHDEWCLVSDADIEEYLEAHPNLQRTRFMLDISRYPGCQNLGLRKGFKVRVKS